MTAQHGVRAMDAIHAEAAGAPELSLIAAVVRQAVVDARAGDAEARAWLGSAACAHWLAWLVPDEADLVAVQAQLVADVDAALERRRARAAQRRAVA